eukprot:Rhum_TRINITY_DN6302_c0_g2::Rhum_TRINITY_DN6302_c0_g2_i1::g.19643::m.19643
MPRRASVSEVEAFYCFVEGRQPEWIEKPNTQRQVHLRRFERTVLNHYTGKGTVLFQGENSSQAQSAFDSFMSIPHARCPVPPRPATQPGPAVVRDAPAPPTQPAAAPAAQPVRRPPASSSVARPTPFPATPTSDSSEPPAPALPQPPPPPQPTATVADDVAVYMSPEMLDGMLITFGKHSGKTYIEVLQGEPGYLEWCRKQTNPSGALRDFIDYTVRRTGNPLPEAPPPQQRRSVAANSSHEKDGEVFTFGKHRARTFLDVYRTEKGYSQWAEKQANPSGPLAGFVEYCKEKRGGYRRVPVAAATPTSPPALPLTQPQDITGDADTVTESSIGDDSQFEDVDAADELRRRCYTVYSVNSSSVDSTQIDSSQRSIRSEPECECKRDAGGHTYSGGQKFCQFFCQFACHACLTYLGDWRTWHGKGYRLTSLPTTDEAAWDEMMPQCRRCGSAEDVAVEDYQPLRKYEGNPTAQGPHEPEFCTACQRGVCRRYSQADNPRPKRRRYDDDDYLDVFPLF